MKFAVGDRVEAKMVSSLRPGGPWLDYVAGVIREVGPIPYTDENVNIAGQMGYLVAWDRGHPAGHTAHMLVEWVESGPFRKGITL